MDRRTLEHELIEFSGGKRLMNISQVADYLGICWGRAAALMKNSSAQEIYVGKKPRYHVHDVATVLTGGKPD